MIRRVCALVAVLALASTLSPVLVAQGGKKIPVRVVPFGVQPPPSQEAVIITDPSGTLTTSASSISLSGTYTSGITDCCDWSNSLTTDTGTVEASNGAWSVAAVSSSNVVFQDAFTESGGSVALASHTPTDAGMSWSVFANTSAATVNASSNDYAGVNTSDTTDGHVVIMQANLASAISGNDYDASIKLPSGFFTQSSADQAVGVVFGLSGSNFCAAYITGTTAARMATNISGVGTAVGTPSTVSAAAGQTWTLSRRSNVYTWSQDGVERNSFTDTGGNCAAKTVGIGWGTLLIGASYDIRTNNGLDDFTVVDPNGGGTDGIPLDVGTNVITVTGTELDGTTMHSATVTVIRTAGADTIDPTGTLTSPSAVSPFSTTNTAVSFGGTYNDNIGVDSVVVDCGMTATPNSITASLVPTSQGATDGTWSAGPFTMADAPSMTACTITITDTSGNDTVLTMRVDEITGTDTTAPTCTITTPNSSGSSTETAASVTLAGTCSDNVAVTRVTYTSDNCGSGTMTGTTAPSVNLMLSSDCTVTMHGFDAANNEGTDSHAFTYSPVVTITTTSVPPTAQQNVAYPNQTLQAIGGTGTYTWDNNAGGTSLGTGACAGGTITDSGNVGIFGGTFTTIGVCNTTVRVCDSDSHCDTQAYTVTVSAAATIKWQDNNYFDSVCLEGGAFHDDMWKCFSLRSTDPAEQAALNYNTLLESGYSWTYDPTNDTHPEKHDGTKLTLYPFGGTGNTFITQAMSAVSSGTIEQLHLNAGIGNLVTGMAIKIGDEIMMCVKVGSDLCYQASGATKATPWVYRGAFGTTAAAHAVGAVAITNKNSVKAGGGIQMPISSDTSTTNTYLFSWDLYYPTEWIGQGQFERGCAVNLPGYSNPNPGDSCGSRRKSFKQWQFESADAVAFETRSIFDSSSNSSDWNDLAATRVASIDLRLYGGVGVGATGGNSGATPIKNGGFTIEAGKTTRYWELFEICKPDDCFENQQTPLATDIPNDGNPTVVATFNQPSIAGSSSVRLIGTTNQPAYGRAIKIDSEILTVESCTSAAAAPNPITCTLKRAQYGSSAAMHSAGATVLANTDHMSIWAADTDTNPTLIYDRIPITFGYDKDTHKKEPLHPITFEWNTSTDPVMQGQIDNGFAELHAYMRNFWALKTPGQTNGMPAAWSGLLVKPTEN